MRVEQAVRDGDAASRELFEGVRMVRGHINRVPVALHEGMRAGFFDGREKFAKPLTEVLLALPGC
jgi:hypothetical protein